MLARTQPNLIDLLVAVFAGLAGAYALVDERISPALPGVAIATAIVPPLSTCGLCIAMGAWTGAFGALLLFLANFVSILLVALLVLFLVSPDRPVEAHLGASGSDPAPDSHLFRSRGKDQMAVLDFHRAAVGLRPLCLVEPWDPDHDVGRRLTELA